MGELEESIKRHPAGSSQKENIWDTAWAISKAMQVGRDDEQERIIKLLEESDSVCNEWAISLIKGEKSE
jgi:hypothetical protein